MKKAASLTPEILHILKDAGTEVPFWVAMKSATKLPKMKYLEASNF